jgi:hypothetical protein
MLNVKKIETDLSSLLSEANNNFDSILSKSREKDEDITSETYQNCAQDYKNIINFIEIFKKHNIRSDLIEFYHLKAWLYNIQSSFNGLPQDSPDEDSNIVLSNDNKIKKFSESLEELRLQVENIIPLDKKKIPSHLKNNWQILKEETKKYVNSWDEIVAYREAVYCYNTAKNLLECVNRKTISKNFDAELVLKKDKLQMALGLLERSENSYKNAKETEEAESILEYKKIIEQKISSLKKLETSIVEKRKILDETEKSLTINNASKPSSSLDSIESHNSNIAANCLTQSNLPLKKRKFLYYLDMAAKEPLAKKPAFSTPKKK